MEVKQHRIGIKSELPVGKIITHPGSGGLIEMGGLLEGEGAYLRGGINRGFTEVMKKISNKFH